jgi:hypothetical protein
LGFDEGRKCFHRHKGLVQTQAQDPASKFPETERPKIRGSLGARESERGRAMEEDQIEKFVAAYLKKKGFKQAEHAFQEESGKKKAS